MRPDDLDRALRRRPGTWVGGEKFSTRTDNGLDPDPDDEDADQ